MHFRSRDDSRHFHMSSQGGLPWEKHEEKDGKTLDPRGCPEDGT